MAKQFSTPWVQETVGNFDNLVHMHFPSIPESYDYAEKNNVRTWIIKQAKKWLGGDRKKIKVRMIFLPSVCAIDLYEFGKVFRIDPAHSFAVEHNESYARYLQAWINAAKTLKGWELFKKLNLFVGKMSEATEVINGQFEIANLDFNGPWNKEVIATLRNLFGNGLLTVPSVLFLTLNDSERWRVRGDRNKPLRRLLPARVQRLTKHTPYQARSLWYMEWLGEGGSKMITYAFGITRKEKRLET